MGLFGPSWSWEEIQKKEDLLGELQKENDRVLKEQQKMLKKYNNSDDSKPTQIDFYISPKDRARGIFYEQAFSSAAFGNILLGKKLVDFSALIKGVGIVIGSLIFMSIIALIINIFSFHVADIFCNICFTLIILLFIIYPVLNRFISPILITKKIKATTCYKRLIEEIKILDNTQYVYCTSKKVCVKYKDGKEKKLLFKQFNFPDLDIKKQGVLLASLIKDLTKQDKNHFKIKCFCNSDTSIYFNTGIDFNKDSDTSLCVYQKENYFFPSMICAQNYRLASIIDREEKSKIKETKKIEKEKRKNGETW